MLPKTPALGTFVRVVQWNIERGIEYPAIRAALADATQFSKLIDSAAYPRGSDERKVILEQLALLKEADVIVLNEVDWGMKRTDYRNVAADLAAALRMNYAYGVEFVEVDPIALGTEEFEELSAEDRATLAHFVRGLPGRFDDVAACGVRDSLVHGDFHPGNFRGDERTLTLLDWGDSGVGHPLLDQPAFLDGVPSGAVDAVRAHWLQQWSEAVPGSDPARASVLLAPVAAARRAVVYRTFLDNIEPSEQPYHRADPAHWLIRTAALVRESDRGGSLVGSGDG